MNSLSMAAPDLSFLDFGGDDDSGSENNQEGDEVNDQV